MRAYHSLVYVCHLKFLQKPEPFWTNFVMQRRERVVGGCHLLSEPDIVCQIIKHIDAVSSEQIKLSFIIGGRNKL